MCGHDGHIVCLLGAIAKILDNRDTIPNNCVVRAIFQPAEEGFGGATLMINDGVMENVDEVYGLHNIPFDPVGKVYVKSGYMMASSDKITFDIKGEGGHGSLIHQLKDPVFAASLLNIKIQHLIENKYSEEQPKNMRMSFPFIKSAKACNIIPDTSILQGALRCFDQKLRESVKKDLAQLAKEVEMETKCSIKMSLFPIANYSVWNDPKLTEEFVNNLGEEVSTEFLPLFASEDFGDYLQHAPGVFFFVAGGTQSSTLHTDCYNFNDNIIDKASSIFLKTVQIRLNLSK
jgi:hippurate hydrolase